MTEPVLIAEELRGLLAEDPVPGHAIRWLSTPEATPAGEYVAIVPLLSREMGAAEFDRLPRLQVVANCAVGFDNIDLVEAGNRRIIVTNTPDVLTDATADLTWALILAVARRLKEGDRLLASGAWAGWHPTQLLGLELRHRVLGIVGAGRIGQAVGERAMGFGMRLLYHDAVHREDFEGRTGAERCRLSELLARSDVVTLHVPSTEQTHAMIDVIRLGQMKPGAILVNTARGDLIDESALVTALDGDRLAGVGLDVFPNEPHVNPRLVQHPRVVAMPHIGSATTVTRRAMAELAVRNVRAVLGGGPPVTPVVT